MRIVAISYKKYPATPLETPDTSASHEKTAACKQDGGFV